MTQKRLPTELIFQIFALLISFIIVHATFITIIRPHAETFLAHEQEQINNNPQHIQQRNFFVVLRDYEQEACIIMMFWALAILSFKSILAIQQQRLLDKDLLLLPDGLPIGTEDVKELLQRLNELGESNMKHLLPRALKTALERFRATHNVQDCATAMSSVCESEGARMESELSTIRYIAWAIPSIGFIGTVRGIGAALSQANRAVEGDITGVTLSLGVAFNSTFIALVISIILMFFIHQLQLIQERLVLDSERYCDTNLITRLRIHPLP